MSKESREWLSQNVLVGCTDARGNAWHHRMGDDNHYPGFIPLGDVERRLFDWMPTVYDRPCQCGCGKVDRDIVRSDTRHRMGTFTDGYQPHDPKEWLVRSVSTILGDTLGVESAGLLKLGAVAWVQVSVPESIQTKVGVTFRPSLLAVTSFDGSLSTTYKRVATFVVCDNTLGAGLGEIGQQYKVKHTKYSNLRLADAREALSMVHTIAEDVDAQVSRLAEITVTDADWFRFLDKYAPEADTDASKRAQTLASNRRDGLTAMYRNDTRVSDWTGTALGVVQAVDTYAQHVAAVRGMVRQERNMLNIANGLAEKANNDALTTLFRVLEQSSRVLVAA